jgi:hypothetical protein
MSAKKKTAGTKTTDSPKKRTKKGPASPPRILNCLPSAGADQDWGLEQAAAAGAVAAAGPLPASVDLRDESWWPIRDQGGTGSCVGQATADALLRWHFVKAKRLDKATPLSVRYVWMAAKETDSLTSQATTFIDADGTTLKSALDVARKFGAVTEDLLPFMGTGLYAGDVKTFYAVAANRKIASYYRLEPKEWRRWIAEVGPILCRLDVDKTWDEVKPDGVLATYRGPGRGGHAVAMVGYTKDHFIVRNSWGTPWADKGYAYASNAYANRAFTEAYGIKL